MKMVMILMKMDMHNGILISGDEKRVSDGGTGECEVEVRGLRLDASLC